MSFELLATRSFVRTEAWGCCLYNTCAQGRRDFLIFEPRLTGLRRFSRSVLTAGLHSVSWLHVQLHLSYLLDLTFPRVTASSEWQQRHTLLCERYFSIQAARQQQEVYQMKILLKFLLQLSMFRRKHVHFRSCLLGPDHKASPERSCSVQWFLIPQLTGTQLRGLRATLVIPLSESRSHCLSLNGRSLGL